MKKFSELKGHPHQVREAQALRAKVLNSLEKELKKGNLNESLTRSIRYALRVISTVRSAKVFTMPELKKLVDL